MYANEGADASYSGSECGRVSESVCFIVCRASSKLDMIIGRFSGRQR